MITWTLLTLLLVWASGLRLEQIDGHDDAPYLRRWHITPMIPELGQLLVHRFQRGDHDDDPHDHSFSFWTLPLTTYVELVMDKDGLLWPEVVDAWVPHYRLWSHTHMVLGPAADIDMEALNAFCAHQRINGAGFSRFCVHKPFTTLLWRSPRRRSWGFWPVLSEREADEERVIWPHLTAGQRAFRVWHDYIATRRLALEKAALKKESN